MNDVVWNKKESIERCVRQIRKYYNERRADLPFAEDHLTQDAVAINIQRACEQAIDLANYTIKTQRYGLPKESRESFRLLAENHIIPTELAENLAKMVGFRNTLVHEYQQLDIGIMTDVIENHIEVLITFTNCILRVFEGE